jgi:CubicO group peptidase (beta-lactamase class C family)
VIAYLLWSQVRLPDTPAGRRFGEWLEVFNRGDRAEMLKFWDGDTERVDRALGNRKQTGGFDLEKIEESSELKISGVMKGRTGGRPVQFTMQVDAEAPHKVAGMQLRPGGGTAPPATRPPAAQRMSESDALAALRAELDRRVAQDQFSGTVMVAKAGKPVFSQAYGLADREKKIPNKLDTKLRIGSMNKMFTATAVVQLAQAGKLKFTDPLGKYLPDYPNQDAASKVTVHHLLTHTGGTGDIFGPEFSQHRASLREPKDYVNLFGKRALEFEPGARFAYSNYGFMILGRIIEVVSGQSYFDYVRDHIYKVAGMSSTDSYPEDQEVPDRSVGYTKQDGPLHPNTNSLPARGSPAGGGYSTAGDLLRFANTLTAHRLLNAEYTEILMTGKVSTGPERKYAYGFGDTATGGVRWFGHNGGSPGMNGDLRIYPESGYTIAVLANLDPPAAGDVLAFIAERLPAK